MTAVSPETPTKRTVFDVRGMDCTECARSVATAVEQLPGVTNAKVNFGAGTLIVEADERSQVDITPRVMHAVEVAGYRAISREAASEVTAVSVFEDNRTRLALAAVALWLAGGITSVILGRPEIARFIYGAAVLAGGWTFGRAAIQTMRARRIDMNVLMTVAIAGALLLGDWAEAAAAAALFAIGNLAQSLTFDRTRNAITSLRQLTPPEALRLKDGREELIAVELLAVGDTVRVRPGERFPIDGSIVEGATTVDESLITGESLPSDKFTGSTVFAGTLNGSGSVLIEVTRIASESTVAQIVELVEEARGGRGHAEQTIDRFAAIYTPTVVVAAAILTIVGGAYTGDWRNWATRGLVLLVIACPCALIISTPVAIVSAVGVAARRGFLIKGGAALETIATIRGVVFDKTGTLTRGRPVVTRSTAFLDDDDKLIRLAAAVEALSEHPLAYAVVSYAGKRRIEIPAASGFVAVTGRGAMATVENQLVWVGSPKWFDELGIPYPPSALDGLGRGQTVLLVAASRSDRTEYIGALALADELRPESAGVIEALGKLDIKPIAMMSGDNRQTANRIADQVGIATVYAELLPEEKSRLVAELRDQIGSVAMVGDGVNDGPALGSATIGFAMGLTGSDLAIETADVAILRNDLYAVPGAIALSRKTVRIIKQNIGISLAIKVIALVLTLLGITTLWMAVAVDLGTSLLVTANALRLTRWQLRGSGHRHESFPYPATGVALGDSTGLAAGDA